MLYREANTDDIAQIQMVRHAVKENVLSDPTLVADEDCKEFLMKRGKGWICEVNGVIAGFAVADLVEGNIWALFLRPEFEGKGIGRQLHNLMLDWYFTHQKEKVWLGTSPNTRAERFYRKMGWKEVGLNGDDEIKFEMMKKEWLEIMRKTNS